MRFWRRGPLVRATIDVGPDTLGNVRIVPTADRWPRHEEADRLWLVVALSAMTLARIDDKAAPFVRNRLTELARAVAVAPTPGDADRFEVPPMVSPAEARIVLEMRHSSIGPAPAMGHTTPPSRVLLEALAALAETALRPVAPEIRLATGLALEGVLGYYRDADPVFQPPQQGVAFALQHAVFRLERAGWVVPPQWPRRLMSSAGSCRWPAAPSPPELQRD